MAMPTPRLTSNGLYRLVTKQKPKIPEIFREFNRLSEYTKQALLYRDDTGNLWRLHGMETYRINAKPPIGNKSPSYKLPNRVSYWEDTLRFNFRAARPLSIRL
jgi:hypothetical protein